MELVSRRLATSHEHAQELIAAGRVTVGGAPAHKPARQVSSAEPVLVSEPRSRFVGRGGHKLQGALESFSISVRGLNCLDAGSSTGGFTDCLLQAGAESVVAVDVGTNQLHEHLRADARVLSLENTDIRSVTLEQFASDSLANGFELLVADLSFISTTSLLPVFERLLAESADAIILVKPQFEADRRVVSKGRGIISSPVVWRDVLHEFIDAAVEAGLTVEDLAISPITGSKGNVEFLAHLSKNDILT